MFYKILSKVKWFKITFEIISKWSYNTYVYSVLDSLCQSLAGTLKLSEPIIYSIKNISVSEKLEKDKIYKVSVVFNESEIANKFIEILYKYFQDDYNSRNIELLKVWDLEYRDLNKILSEITFLEEIISTNCLILDYKTPLAFKLHHKKKRTLITELEFIKLFITRINRFFKLEIQYSENPDIIITPNWHYFELKESSHSQIGHTRYINGVLGKICIKGAIDKYLPIFLICSDINSGSTFSYGRGYYVIKSPMTSILYRFPDPDEIRTLINVENKNKFTKENGMVQEIYKILKGDSYKFSPIKILTNKDGIQYEEIELKDKIIHKVVNKKLKQVVDNILPVNVVGFRTGISTEDIKQIIEEGIRREGRCFLKFDIKGIYTNANHEILINNLKEYFSTADLKIVNLIEAILKTEYINEKNKIILKRSGLPKGSPISHLLANFYLLPFDKMMIKEDIFYLRFIDKVLILSGEREVLEIILKKAKDLLKILHLEIDENSVIINDTFKELNFAGAKISNEQKNEQIKKSLYISNIECSLRIDAETVNISKNGKPISSIPLNRIGEVIITVPVSLTTNFIEECADRKINILINTRRGYNPVIIHSISKTNIETIVKHTFKYESLTEEEKLSYAKQIVVLKNKSYVKLFEKRRHKEIKELRELMEKINQSIERAENLNLIRGYEALAAKEIYGKINFFINNPDFHISVRNRRKPDFINSLLNISSVQMFNKINLMIYSKGLNPYLGFLHSPKNNYESLTVDLQELYRAIIDNFIINLINLRTIKKDDFENRDGKNYLNSVGWTKFIQHFEAYLNKELTKDNDTIYDHIEKQVLAIKNWVNKEDKELFLDIPW